MFEKIKEAVIPHLVGLGLMVAGWLFSINYVGLNKFQSNVLFTKETGLGLLMIVIGAYLPEIWIGIRNKVRN
jgi:hypothetical protein